MNQENKKLYIYVFIAAVTLAVFYFFIKLPEFTGRRQRELAASREISVTIPEGYNAEQIGGIFEKLGIFSKNDFIKIGKAEEGYLFPDTYRFYKDTKPEDVARKMRDNFERKITPEILSRIKSEKLTLSQVITMASILEEEVGGAEDRRIVAGILWKRLELGMGLNVDAALTYILGKPSKDLTANDLNLDSPYNTYRYKGLPPTPISNPGLDTILAASNPLPTPYFYYLTGKNGEFHYAKTLEEHALNKFKYLR